MIDESNRYAFRFPVPEATVMTIPLEESHFSRAAFAGNTPPDREK
jgi:hypothetical protein